MEDPTNSPPADGFGMREIAVACLRTEASRTYLQPTRLRRLPAGSYVYAVTNVSGSVMVLSRFTASYTYDVAFPLAFVNVLRLLFGS